MSRLRLLKSSEFYKKYLLHYYKMNEEMKRADYKIQHESLMFHSFGWSDFWKTHLEASGNFEVIETIMNNRFIQEKWLEEQGIKKRGLSFEDMIEEQIRYYEPDLWFAHSFMISPEFRIKMKKKYPFLKKVIFYDGQLLHDENYLQGCDLVLSCVEDTLDYYKLKGFDTYFMPYAFDEKIMERAGKLKRIYPVSFVGSFFPFRGIHSKRLEFVYQLTRREKIDLWAPDILGRGKSAIYNITKLLSKGQFKEFRYAMKLEKERNGTVFGLDMFRILLSSGITLNFHGDIVHKAANIRLFEATGSGALLLTDWKENLSEFFEPGKEVVTFRSLDECIEKINYYRENEEEREIIARAGQKKTLENYSYSRLLSKFGDFLAGYAGN